MHPSSVTTTIHAWVVSVVGVTRVPTVTIAPAAPVLIVRWGRSAPVLGFKNAQANLVTQPRETTGQDITGLDVESTARDHRIGLGDEQGLLFWDSSRV
jgi:hypothetical protein